MIEDYAAAGLVAVVALGAVAGLAAYQGPETPETTDSPQVERFGSAEEMRSYLRRSDSSGSATSGFDSARSGLEAQTAADAGAPGGSGGVERSSGTNIQEAGVQEPDILKADGKDFYYSPETGGYSIMTRAAAIPRMRRPGNVSVFSGLEQNFSTSGSIDDSGEMLLSGKLLAVQNREGITGYNISNPESREELWSLDLNGSVVASREINGSIYLVMREDADYGRPCPVPLASGSDSLTVDCGDIGYLPSERPEADSTYTAMKLSGDGKIQESTTVVGSSSNTVVYVSRSSIYLTTQERMSDVEILSDFLDAEGDALFTSSEMERIEEILGYNISEGSKMDELERVFRSHTRGMSEEETEEWRTRFENRLGNYTADNRREFTETRIAEIGLESMDVDRTGSVPGRVNDQFSMDERDGRLRIATTVGPDSWRIPDTTANDLYVLDSSLEVAGSVQGMGLDERIYSVRFIDDRAYIVTFRRVDPFHVVDLSEPENPELKGTLKLPGFSTYLHGLGNETVLGIGEEEGNVKAVIFDVSDDEPSILDSKVLEDYSSEINQNHHAFTLDRKHGVFFLPGDSGGYIYSYRDGLEEVMELEIEDPKRARYVNDHLYVFGDYSVSVIDENSWESVKKVEFRDKPNRTAFKEPRVRPDLER